MPVTHDVVAITGEYEKDGQTKARYQNVGVVIEKDGKRYIKLHSLVTMHDNGQPVTFFSLFSKDRDQAKQAPADGGAADDIPFAPVDWRTV